MLIYQFVRIKYALDTNAYVHICVCVRARVCVFEWQHLIHSPCALALIQWQSPSLSWLPISVCWLVQSHQTSNISVHLLATLGSLVCLPAGWYWLSNQCFDCCGGGVVRMIIQNWMLILSLKLPLIAQRILYVSHAAIKFPPSQTISSLSKMIISAGVRAQFPDGIISCGVPLCTFPEVQFFNN